MTLETLLVQLGLVVGVTVGVAAVPILGRARIRSLRGGFRRRFGTILPYLVLLGGVLLVNSVTRKIAPGVSWLIGVNVTGVIYAIEGGFVAAVQSLATPTVTAYLSFMYVYGYVFLLVFPIVAYFALDDLRAFRELCLAYSFNYGIGLLCYVAFIAYGPRNLMPDLVEPLLYTSWPQSKLLTTQVNTNTNAFPSLHTALSITVVVLAYRTRSVYPRWLWVAGVVGGSIVFSTMYLGIHWLMDVVAGGVLALVSVSVATHSVEREWGQLRAHLSDSRTGRFLGRAVRTLRRFLASLR